MAIRGHGGAKNLVPKRLLCPCNVLNADADTLADAFVNVHHFDRWKSNSTLRSVLPLALFVSCAFQLSQT